MSQAGTDLNVKIEQLQGQAFLEAFESLKGGGSITEREGLAAQNAMARLQRAQSTEAYVESLNELKGILELGRSRAQSGERVGETPTAPAMASPISMPAAPDGIDPSEWSALWPTLTDDEKAAFQ